MAVLKVKRERPADGGMVYDRRIHAFQCQGCGEWTDLRKRSEYEDPEALLRIKEMLIADHTECWEFDDPEMARNARRFRKEKKRRGLLEGSRQQKPLDCSAYLRRGR